MLTQDQLDTHALWETVIEARKSATSLAERGGGEEGRLLLFLHTTIEVLDYVSALKKLRAWHFADKSLLDGLNEQLLLLIEDLGYLADDPDVSSVTELQNRLGDLADKLTQSPIINIPSEGLAEISQISDQFRSGVASALSEVIERASLVEVKAREASNTSQKMIAEVQSKQEELLAAIAASKKEVVSQSARLDAALNRNSTAFSEKLSEWQTQQELSLKEGVRAAEEIMANLKVLETQAENVVNATARNSISTEFGQQAKREDIAANGWSIGAVAIAVLAGAFLTGFLMDVHEASIQVGLMKATATLFFLGIASFMGREGSGHRKEARDYRRAQLDLNAIGPFIANMEEARRQEMQEDVAKRVFLRPPANEKNHAGFAFLTGRKSSEDQDAAA